MSELKLSRPVPGVLPAHRSMGRLRVLVAVALALALHSLMLLPTQPTLVSSAARDAPPAMFVRVLAAGTEAVAALASLEVQAAPPPSAKATPPDVGKVPAGRSRNDARLPGTPLLSKGNQSATDGAATPLSAPNVLPTTVAAGLPPAPAYAVGGRLDPGPTPLDVIEPTYPEEANLQEGSVVLRLLINEAGAVDNVAVVRGDPPGLFEAAALEAFGRARFSPGRIFGVAVKSQITIEVMFTPINRGRVSGRSY